VRGVVEGISGVVLVGGKSRRMGRDKALLTVGGRPLIQRVAEALREVVNEVLLVGASPERYAWLNVRVVDDLIPGGGPLGGIHTALSVARYSRCLIAACDMPFLNPHLLRYMLGEATWWDAVVPRSRGQLEPLHAVYARSCMGPIERMLEKGNLCPLDLFPRVRVRYVEAHEAASLEDRWLSFVNVNTPFELRLARAVGGVSLWGHMDEIGWAAERQPARSTLLSTELHGRPLPEPCLPGGKV